MQETPSTIYISEKNITSVKFIADIVKNVLEIDFDSMSDRHCVPKLLIRKKNKKLYLWK